MKRIWFLFQCVLLALAVFAAFRTSEQARLRYTAVSLRYNQPLPAALAAAAKQQMVKAGGVNLTFWGEQTVPASSMTRSAEAKQILFDGEAMLACPAQYIYGKVPVRAGECAVSSAAAEALWGAQNVVGLEVTISEKTCTVVGVFTGSDKILLNPGTGDWTAAELHSIPSGADGWKYGRDYAMQFGLPQPDQVLWGSGFAYLASVLPWLPLLLCGFWAAAFFLRWLWKRSHTAFLLTLTGLAFAFVLLLPRLLSGLPAWLIPTKWSDFSFWSNLSNSLVERFYDYLAVSPKVIDVAGKAIILKTTIDTLLAMIIITSLIVQAMQSRSLLRISKAQSNNRTGRLILFAGRFGKTAGKHF